MDARNDERMSSSYQPLGWNAHRLRQHIRNDWLRMKDDVLRKALALVQLHLNHFRFATTTVFRLAFAAAGAILFLAADFYVLEFFAAGMMRNAEAANIGSEQQHQYDCDEFFHRNISGNVARYTISICLQRSAA